MNKGTSLNFAALENVGVSVQPQALLSECTTFRLGGQCPALLTCKTPEQLRSTVQFFVEEKAPFILIGAGSNLVVSDDGIDRHVVRYVCDGPLIERDGNVLVVAAGTALDDLVRYAAENGLEGLNSMTGIPGTVGGAVVGNAGAFGEQVGDAVETVEVISRDGRVERCSAADLKFSYRHSILKETGEIVASVRFSLKPGDRDALQKQREDIFALRREKHPDWNVFPCAGSFFRNIEPTSSAGKREAAGWFLEEAGAMDLRCGGAAVYEHHANIILGSAQCRAQDVYDLSVRMAQAVKAKYDLDLVREVRFVGTFKGMPENIDGIIW